MSMKTECQAGLALPAHLILGADMTKVNPPKISVIIVTYNYGHFIHEAIKSVFDQTYQDFEIIVVDDGSTDETQAIIQTFADPRLRYIYQENAGQAIALNTGIRNCMGEYVAFLDADDYFLPHRLEDHVKTFDERPEVGLAASGVVYINEVGQVTGEKRPWEGIPQLDLETWLFECPTVPSAISVRRNWLEKMGGFDESLPCAIDYNLWVRLAYAGCTSVWVKSLVCAYRIHSNNMTKNTVAFRNGTISALDKFYAMPNLPDRLVALQSQLYSNTYLRSACQEYANGLVELARQDMERAVKLDPALLESQGQRIFEMILMWAPSPRTGDPIAYIKTIFENLPDTTEVLRQRVHEAIKVAAMDTFYQAYRDYDWPRLRRAFVTAGLNRPTLFLNRGILSIVIESFFGSQFINQVRRIVP
jgi:glycosyltransferase involved in cell wall biosynthesis